MSNEIIKVLDNLAERFGVAIDWTAQNVMPYLQDLYGRIINYRLMMLIAMCVFCFIGMVVGIILFIKSRHDYIEIYSNMYQLKSGSKISNLFWCTEKTYDYISNDVDMTFYGILLSWLAGSLLIIGGVGIFISICDIIEVINIPEIYIYYMIQEMM